MTFVTNCTCVRARAIHITLPLPPSLNNLYKNAGKRRVCTVEYDDWKFRAGFAAKKAGRSPITGGYVVYLGLPKNMRGDIDNRFKPVLDLLVRMSITPDDRHCQGVMAWRHDCIDSAQCEVLIDECVA